MQTEGKQIDQLKMGKKGKVDRGNGGQGNKTTYLTLFRSGRVTIVSADGEERRLNQQKCQFTAATWYSPT